MMSSSVNEAEEVTGGFGSESSRVSGSEDGWREALATATGGGAERTKRVR